jgi:hypothetical protein
MEHHSHVRRTVIISLAEKSLKTRQPPESLCLQLAGTGILALP